MANFHHITPTMGKVTMSQRLGPSPLHQAPGSYHGSQSCPSSGYPALSETHYHPSQVSSSAQRSVTEHTHSGGRNTGPYNPPGPAPTHNPLDPPGHNVFVGYSGPPGHGDPPPSVSQPHTVNTLNPHDPQSPYAIPQMSSSHLPPPQYPTVDPPITPLSRTVNPPNPSSAHPVKGNNNGVGFQSGYLPPPDHSQFTVNNNGVGFQLGYLPPPNHSQFTANNAPHPQPCTTPSWDPFPSRDIRYYGDQTMSYPPPQDNVHYYPVAQG